MAPILTGDKLVLPSLVCLSFVLSPSGSPVVLGINLHGHAILLVNIFQGLLQGPTGRVHELLAGAAGRDASSTLAFPVW